MLTIVMMISIGTKRPSIVLLLLGEPAPVFFSVGEGVVPGTTTIVGAVDTSIDGAIDSTMVNVIFPLHPLPSLVRNAASAASTLLQADRHMGESLMR
mmetsp:Transcript_8008/g.9997  ORF Transcript_8008/g.9997 Transcript_8008/m.9997 type:complete len:97 (-) Transcript_8008:498-788(-)